MRQRLSTVYRWPKLYIYKINEKPLRKPTKIIYSTDFHVSLYVNASEILSRWSSLIILTKVHNTAHRPIMLCYLFQIQPSIPRLYTPNTPSQVLHFDAFELLILRPFERTNTSDDFQFWASSVDRKYSVFVFLCVNYCVCLLHNLITYIAFCSRFCLW